MHVSATENPEDASFFESYEAAHSMHDLSSTIAKVLHFRFPLYKVIFVFLTFEFYNSNIILMNRNLESKPPQLELTARQSMGHFPEEMEQYIFVSPIKDIARKYGIMLLVALLLLVKNSFFSYIVMDQAL